MRRVAMLAALSVGLVGCGGDGSSVSQVTVTVRQAGLALGGVDVVASAGIDSARPPNPTGVMETRATDASGKTTFTVPSSTSTGELCFSSYLPLPGGYSFDRDCRTLNALAAAVTLEHD
jgi:hypothetical protein